VRSRLIALVHFESEEAARRNSERPEQDKWWAETARLFTGEPTFRHSRAVVLDVTGEPADAGFVQVMQGRSSDPARARELMGRDAPEWAAFRPDVIGSVGAEHDDGAYTMALYFTSEEAAREGERKQPPPELKHRWKRWRRSPSECPSSSTSSNPGWTPHIERTASPGWALS